MIKYLLIALLVVVNIYLIIRINQNKENYQVSSDTCTPEDADISGNTVIQCVTRCKNNSNEACSLDNDGNQIDILPPSQQFLNKYPNIHLNAPGPSDQSNIELQGQSECLKRCLSCGWKNEGKNCKCSWSNDCLQDTASSYEDFKEMWNSKDFRIGAIPEDKKITHGDVIKNEKNNIYIVDGLLNNVQYGIQVNKVSKSFPGKTKLVKTSNTIYGVPSEINLLNFSNISNTQKECDSLAENLLDNFVGREFEINLG